MMTGVSNGRYEAVLCIAYYLAALLVTLSGVGIRQVGEQLDALILDCALLVATHLRLHLAMLGLAQRVAFVGRTHNGVM